MGTRIYMTDGNSGNWINTPVSYETIKSWLLIERPLVAPYIEVPGEKGHTFLIKISNISCIMTSNKKEEKKL